MGPPPDKRFQQLEVRQVWNASIGGWPGRPCDLSNAEAERPSNIWETKPQEQRQKHRRPSPEALAEPRPITAIMIRAAAKRFSHNAAPTYDGFRPCYFAFRGDDELELVSRFVRLSEAVGLLPSQVRATVTVIIPKHKLHQSKRDKPGFRGIGPMSSIWRL